jgi:serine/threonine protein kinase
LCVLCLPYNAADELVAVKAVDATRFCSISGIEQVQEEMAVLAQMRHPNIIRLHEVVFVSGCFYFVMEYASGGCLKGHLARQPGGRLCEAAAKQVFGSILAGLEYCHKRWAVVLLSRENAGHDQTHQCSVSSLLCSSFNVTPRALVFLKW